MSDLKKTAEEFFKSYPDSEKVFIHKHSKQCFFNEDDCRAYALNVRKKEYEVFKNPNSEEGEKTEIEKLNDLTIKQFTEWLQGQTDVEKLEGLKKVIEKKGSLDALDQRIEGLGNL